jgi:uncharacterized membrane protein YccC
VSGARGWRAWRALDVEVATRAAIAVAIPLVTLLAIGRIEWAAYASFGAMTALYGRNERYALRVRTVSVAAVGLIASIAFGTLMAAIQAPLWLLAVGLALVITIGTLVAATAGLFPPSPIFFVFSFTVCAQIPTAMEEVPLRLMIAVVCASFAWLLTMSGWLLRRLARSRSDLFKPPSRTPVLRTAAWRDRLVWLAVFQNVAGSLIAGALAIAVGIGHPYWAVVAVTAVVPPPRAPQSTTRALHRIVGTAAGVFVTALVFWPDPPAVVLIIVAVVGQFGAEILVGKHYGAALLFITPLALCVSHLSSPVPVPQLLGDRVIETALGAVVGIAFVLLGRRWLRSRAAR